jgi:hypothetical protein
MCLNSCLVRIHKLYGKQYFFDFSCLLADLKLEFKHITISYLDELLSLPYMNEKLEIYSFHPN